MDKPNKFALRWTVAVALFLVILIYLFMFACARPAKAEDHDHATELGGTLAAYPHRIVHESLRDDNWELILRNADGSSPVNLTNTPQIDEVYPQASPNGRWLAFEQHEPTTRAMKLRSIALMPVDGGERKLVAEWGRQPAWSPDGSVIAFMQGEPWVGGTNDSIGLRFYDAASGTIREHPNPELRNLSNLSWSPDGRWLVATVAGGMGFSQSIVAVEADGNGFVNLIHQSPQSTPGLWGCRPDLSPDGRRIAWSMEKRDDSMWIAIADLDWSGGRPRAGEPRFVATVRLPTECYHADWSPDGRFILFSSGPKTSGLQPARYRLTAHAPGWDVFAVEIGRPEILHRLTGDGLSNKEPDWVRRPE